MKFVMPEVVTSQFHLRPGDKVADFGAGRGFFLEPLAAAVGSDGEVILCEIQKPLVELLSEQVRLKNYSNIKPAWCDLEEVNGIPIQTHTLDVGIMVNTLFQIEDRDTALKEILRTVRPGGKFFVIDWTESIPGLGPTPDHLVPQADCVALFEGAGCVLEREFPAGDHHYGVAFRTV